MVKHIVTFKFSGTEEEKLKVAQEFKAALEDMPGKISVLQGIEVGINQNPNENWNLVLTAVVPTIEDVAVYASHPIHVAATSIIAGHKEARACVDYEF